MEFSQQEYTFRQGVVDCVPTLLGYLSIGFAAGVIGKSAGLSVAEIALLSILVYAGSAQFIFAAMFLDGQPATAIVLTIFFVNLRHLLMSASISPYFRHLRPGRTILVGALLTDETYGVASSAAEGTKRLSERWMHGLNVTAYLNWILANIVGAMLGQWIANPVDFGLDFALTGMFIGLLVLQLYGRKRLMNDIGVIIVSVLTAAAIGATISESFSIIAATFAGATAGMVMDRWKSVGTS